MKLTKFVATLALTLGIAGAAAAQQMQAPPQGDQVDQLDQLLDLDENQQQEIRGLLDEAERQLAPKEQEAQALQARLGEYVGPDFDENAIRQCSKNSRLRSRSGRVPPASAPAAACGASGTNGERNPSASAT